MAVWLLAAIERISPRVRRAAGDEYQALRRYLPDPSLGPHDPTTAVELAALVLIWDKGAPTGQPIDAYVIYVRAYNGSGPRLMAIPRACWPTPTPTRALGPRRSGLHAARRWVRRSCPGRRRGSCRCGDAAAPANAPTVVEQMIAAGNRIDHFPYSYASGHGAVAQTMNQTTPDPAAYLGGASLRSARRIVFCSARSRGPSA